MSIDDFRDSRLSSTRRAAATKRPSLELLSRSMLLMASAALIACATEQVADAQESTGCWVQGARTQLASRASKLDSSVVALGGDTIKVCYGRPSARGRKIMGNLVPYGQPWRLGANEATTVHVPFAAKIAGVSVKPGWYSIYVVPQEKEWQVVVNGEPQRWGIPINPQVRSKDVGTGTVQTAALAQPVETLTIALRSTSKTAATMDVSWANTRVSIPIQKQ